MLDITKLEFITLDISGKNYLAQTIDVEIHLDAMILEKIIKEGNKASLQDGAKAMLFLLQHLNEGLKAAIKDPYVLRVIKSPDSA